METQLDRFTVPAHDGFPLAAIRWLPKEAPRAILQIAHGMAEHAPRYAPFARAAAAMGIAVYAHDHRGHGASINDSAPRGHFADQDGFEKVLRDIGSVGAAARAAHEGLPRFLLGHSMGSFFTRARVLEGDSDPLAGVILSATGWRLSFGNKIMQSFAKRQVKKHGASAPSPFMTKLVFGSFNLRFLPARTAFDWLSRDPAVVDAYMADPLCGFDCSGQLWSDLLGAVYEIEQKEGDPSKLPRDLPTLLVVGTHDPVSMGGLGHRQLAARYRAAGNNDVTDKYYEAGRHELLNETNRADVWSDILGWVEQRLG
ncbi:MAG: alpha/beta fold hydrolase [Polyangiaceae bacterium]